MSWARSFYLREWSLLYRHRRIMSSCLCSEWSLWSFSSKMSKVSIMLIMLTVITSDSSDQSNHFEILITQWLSNHFCYVITCERVLTKVTKHRSLYHVIWKQKKLKAAMLKTFTKTFINLKSLMNNNLKRKQRHSMNESYLLNAVITSENTILNHLIKKSRSNELKSTLITSLSMSSSVKNLTDEVSTLQTLKRTLNSLKCEL